MKDKSTFYTDELKIILKPVEEIKQEYESGNLEINWNELIFMRKEDKQRMLSHCKTILNSVVTTALQNNDNNLYDIILAQETPPQALWANIATTKLIVSHDFLDFLEACIKKFYHINCDITALLEAIKFHQSQITDDLLKARYFDLIKLAITKTKDTDISNIDLILHKITEIENPNLFEALLERVFNMAIKNNNTHTLRILLKNIPPISLDNFKSLFAQETLQKLDNEQHLNILKLVINKLLHDIEIKDLANNLRDVNIFLRSKDYFSPTIKKELEQYTIIEVIAKFAAIKECDILITDYMEVLNVLLAQESVFWYPLVVHDDIQFNSTQLKNILHHVLHKFNEMGKKIPSEQLSTIKSRITDLQHQENLKKQEQETAVLQKELTASIDAFDINKFKILISDYLDIYKEAASNDQIFIPNYQIGRTNNNNILHYLITKKFTKAIEFLLSDEILTKLSPDLLVQQNSNGTTSLHMAVTGVINSTPSSLDINQKILELLLNKATYFLLKYIKQKPENTNEETKKYIEKLFPKDNQEKNIFDWVAEKSDPRLGQVVRPFVHQIYTALNDIRSPSSIHAFELLNAKVSVASTNIHSGKQDSSTSQIGKNTRLQIGEYYDDINYLAKKIEKQQAEAEQRNLITAEELLLRNIERLGNQRASSNVTKVTTNNNQEKPTKAKGETSPSKTESSSSSQPKVSEQKPQDKQIHPLKSAIENKNIELLQELMKTHKQNLDSKDPKAPKDKHTDEKYVIDSANNNIFHLVIKNKFTEGLKYLISLVEEGKLDINLVFAKNITNNTPFHLAVNNNNFDQTILETLLDWAIQSNQKYNLIHAFGRNNNKQTIFDIAKKHDEIKQLLHKKLTPLIVDSIEKGDQKFLEHLVKLGFNINESLENGDTMLHIAVTAGNVGMIRYLMDRNAKTDIKNDQQISAMDMAKNSENKVIAQIFMPKPMGAAGFDTALDSSEAKSSGSLESSKQAKTDEVKIDESVAYETKEKAKKAKGANKIDQGEIWAEMQSTHYSKFIEWVKAGLVNVNYCDSYGNTALHYAAASGSKSWVEELLKHGANQYSLNKKFQRPIDMAAEQTLEILYSKLTDIEQSEYKELLNDDPKDTKPKTKSTLKSEKQELSLEAQAKVLVDKILQHNGSSHQNTLITYSKEFKQLLENDEKSSRISLETILKIFTHLLSKQGNKPQIYIEELIAKMGYEAVIFDKDKIAPSQDPAQLIQNFLVAIIDYAEHYIKDQNKKTANGNIGHLKSLLHSWSIISVKSLNSKLLNEHHVKSYLEKIPSILHKLNKQKSDLQDFSPNILTLVNYYEMQITKMIDKIAVKDLINIIELFDKFRHFEITTNPATQSKFLARLDTLSLDESTSLNENQMAIILKSFAFQTNSPNLRYMTLNKNLWTKSLELLESAIKEENIKYIAQFLSSFSKLNPTYQKDDLKLNKQIFEKICNLLLEKIELFDDKTLINIVHALAVIYESNNVLYSKFDSLLTFQDLKQRLDQILYSKNLSDTQKHKLIIFNSIATNSRNGILDTKTKENHNEDLKQKAKITISDLQQNVTKIVEQVISDEYIVKSEQWIQDIASNVDIAIYPKNPQNSQQKPILIIQVDGPSHFIANRSSSKPTASTELNTKLLVDSNYQILRISYRDWNKNKNANNLQEYIAKLIAKIHQDYIKDEYKTAKDNTQIIKSAQSGNNAKAKIDKKPDPKKPLGGKKFIVKITESDKESQESGNQSENSESNSNVSSHSSDKASKSSGIMSEKIPSHEPSEESSQNEDSRTICQEYEKTYDPQLLAELAHFLHDDL